jgi:hypothetical protein
MHLAEAAAHRFAGSVPFGMRSIFTGPSHTVLSYNYSVHYTAPFGIYENKQGHIVKVGNLRKIVKYCAYNFKVKGLPKRLFF